MCEAHRRRSAAGAWESGPGVALLPRTGIWLCTVYWGDISGNAVRSGGGRTERGKPRQGTLVSGLLRALGFTPAEIPPKDPVEHTLIVLWMGREPKAFSPRSTLTGQRSPQVPSTPGLWQAGAQRIPVASGRAAGAGGKKPQRVWKLQVTSKGIGSIHLQQPSSR